MEKQKLPSAIAVLVLGILSILTCWCYGVFGIILSGIGLFLTHKDLVLYNQDPEKYDNYQNLNTGKILCIIGLVLSAIMLLMFIWVIKKIGLDAFQDPALLEQRMRELQGR